MGPQAKQSWAIAACVALLLAACGGGTGGPPGPIGEPVIHTDLVPQSFPKNAPVTVQVSQYEQINVTISEGQTLTLTANVTGSTPMVYFWRLDGKLIDGFDGTTLTVSNFSAKDEGLYTFSAGNQFGKVISRFISVKLADKP